MKLRTAVIAFATVLVAAAYTFVQPRIAAQGGVSQAPADSDLDGTLEVVYEDGYTAPRLRHFIKVGTDRIELNFSGRPPRLATGTHIRARGRFRNGRLDLSPLQVEALGGSGAPNVGQSLVSPFTFGPQSTLVILFNFTDLNQQPYTTSSAQNVTFTQVNSFDLENSFNQTSLTGTVTGWYTINMSATTGGCNYPGWATAAEQAATNAGVDLSQYPRRVFGFPQTSACSWWGLGTIGGGSSANPSRAWINGTFNLRVVAHEMGHNFGLYHSRSNTCDSGGCVVDEYGDDHDAMGGGPSSITGHFNAYQKERIGWLDFGSSPSVLAVNDAGQYAIESYATPWGGLPKALRVIKSSNGGSTTYVYAEARTQYGIDSSLAPGVIIHTGTDTDGSLIYEEDVQPTSTNTDFILDVGQSVTFPDASGGVTLRTLSFDSSGATIEVTPSCPFSLSSAGQAFGPTGGAGSVSMTTSAGCAWTATSDSPWLTVNAGSTSGTGSATIQYTVATNPGSTTRTGTLTIGSQTYTVAQTGNSCAFTASPTSQFFNYLGGNGSVSVTTSSGCNWNATSNAAWIIINTGASGTGNGTVTYSVASQLAAHSSRTGTMTVAGQTVTITQEGVAAQFVTPTDGATGVSAPSTTFQWTNVSASRYILLVGTTPGGSDLVNTGELTSSTTSFTTASVLPSSTLLYARVRTKWNSVTFTAADISFTTTDHVTGIQVLGSPSPSPVIAGGSTQYGAAAGSSVKVTFSGSGGGCSVTLSATGLPSGASATFNPSTLASSAASQYSLMSVSTTGSTPPGTVNFTVRAQESVGCGSGLSTTTAPLSVISPTALSANTASGTYGGSAGLSATLTSGGSPVSGKSVAFTLNGASVGSATTNGSGVATIASASLSGIAAGTYSSGVSASFAGDATYASSNATSSLTVGQKSVTPSIIAAAKPYDGNASATLTSCTLSGLVGGDVATCSGTATFADAAVGTGKTVTATGLSLTGAQAANYTLSTTTATTTANITAVSVAPGVTAANKVYDRAVSATLSSCTLTGVIGGDVVTCSGTATFASASVGTGKTVTATGIGLGGAQAGNYTLSTTTATTTANITAVSVTPSVTASNKPYDGTTSATLNGCSLSGVIGPDVVMCSGTASFATAAVGSGKTVNATGLSLSGAQAGNYALSSTSATTTANITAASVTPSITAANKPYDRTTAATINSCTLSGVLGGDVVTCAGSATFDTASIGTGKTVTASGITLSGAQSGNYTLSTTTATGTANITAISVTPSVTANSKTYDVTTNATLASCTLTGVLGGDVVTCSGTASFATAGVGTGKTVNVSGLVLGGGQGSNYTLSTTTASTTANVTAASLAPSIIAASKPYDSTSVATITNCALGGVLGSDVVTCSGAAAFNSAAVGNGKPVTATGLTLGGAAAANYSLSSTTAATTANITAASVTPSVTAANKPYDRTTAATILNCSLTGIVGGDVVSCSGTAAFNTASVGAGKTVTATGLALGGAAATNYTLSTTTATTTADITAISVTPSISVASRPYDRTTAATISTCTLTGVLAPDVVTCSGAATFDSPAVGPGKTVTATGLTLGGAAAADYALSTTTTTTTAAITAVNVAPAVTAANKPYDGSTLATVTNCALTGVLSGDSVTCGAGAAHFDTATVATGKTVTATAITLGGANAGNYALNPATATTTAAITAIPLAPAVTAANKPYDGTTAATLASCALTGVVAGDTVTCSGSASFDSPAVGTGKTVTATGLTLGGAQAGNYTLSTTTANTTASIAALTVAPTITVADRPYDGATTASVTSCTLSGVVGSDSVSCTGSAHFGSANVGSGKTVSSTDLMLTGPQAGNYALTTTSATTTASITALSLTPAITASNKPYDGTTTAALGSCTLTGVIGADVVQCSGPASFDTASVGVNKTVTATGLVLSGAAAGNYTLASTSAATTAAITAAPVSPVIAAASKTYDGSATASLTSCTLNGLVGGDVVTCNGAATFDSPSAGMNKTVTATGLTLTGPAAANYSLASTSAATTASITPLALAPTVGVASKPYDGTVSATITACTLVGTLGGDVVSCAGTATFNSAAVGAGKTVTAVNLAPTGPAAGNYALTTTTATTTAAITAANLTPAITAASKTYDGAPAAALTSCTLTGVLNGDQVACSGTASFDSAIAGAGKTVTTSSLTLSGADAGNYSLSTTTVTTTADITPLRVTPIVVADEKQYDGTSVATLDSCQVGGAIGADVVGCAGTGVFDTPNVGHFKPVTVSNLTLTGAAAANYTLATSTATTVSTIVPRDITPTVTVASKSYDGSNAAPVTNCALNGTVTGDDVRCGNVLALFETADIGTNKLVSVISISLAGTAAPNYILDPAAITLTASITSATLTPSIAAVSKTYDGSTAALLANCTLAGIQGNDAVYCAATGSYGSADVGPDSTVTTNSVTLLGPAAANYTLASTSLITTASIVPAAAVPAITAASRQYDGTALATLTSCTLEIARPITIAWDSSVAEDGVIGYQVRVTAMPGGVTQVFDVGSATSFVYPNVLLGQEYAFAVAAHNVIGIGAFSDVSGSSQPRNAFSADEVSCAGPGSFDSPAMGTNKTVTVSPLVLVGADAANYTLGITTATTTAAITGGTVTPAITIASRPYDGTTSATISGCTLSGIVSGDNVTCAGAATLDTPTAGTGKTVTVTGLALTGPDSGNYTLLTTTVTAVADITQAGVTPAITAAGKTYDGTDAATLTGCSVTGLISGDSVACAGTAHFDSPTAGTNKTVTALDLAISGLEASNYQLSTTAATTTASITRALVTPTVVIASKIYDGTTVASISSCTVVGLLGGDQVGCNGVAAFDNGHVGTGKTVTVTNLALTGPAAGNYQLVDPSLQFALVSITASGEIDPRSVTASVTVAGRTYDGTTAATPAGCSLMGVVAGDAVGCAGSAAFDSASAAVAKHVTVSGLMLTGADAGNYVLSSTSGSTTATIAPLVLTPAVTASNRPYDGTTLATLTGCQVSGSIGGDVVGCVGTATFDTPNAGAAKTVTATLTLTGAAANYALVAPTATTTATIDPLTVSPVVSVSNKTYDGTMTAAINNCVITGTLNGDVVACSGTALFDSANVGTGKAVGISSLTLTGAGAANYALSAPNATATANIVPLALSANGVVAVKTYDGTTTAALASCSVQGTLEGDSVTCTGAAAFSSAAAGTNKSVTISGLSLAGASASNYTLSSTTATATGTINPRSVMPGITVANKRYDGTTSVTVTGCTLSGVVGVDPVTCSASATFASPTVGTNKLVTATQVTLGGAAAGNYALSTTTPTTTASIAANALPVITNPGSQIGYQGVALTLPLTATDADSDPLTWSSTSLVPGTTLNPSTGVISGTPTAQGGFTVVVNAFDGWDTTQVSFSWAVGSPVPVAASLSSPIGSITTTTPTFTWPAVPLVEYYLLWVTDSGSDSPLQVWYTPTQAGCAAGGNCVASSPRALKAGLVTWKVITWNHFGYGPWSSLASAVVDFADPSVPTPTTIGPSGAIGTRTPTYSWGTVTNATWYQLSITDALGVVREFWYTPSQACTTSCAANPTSPVAVGLAKWHVRAWRVTGAGAWSGYTNFDAADGVPGTPTLLTPTGSVTSSTTSFTWNALSSASYYLLRFTDRDNVATERWYRPADVGCPLGTGTCTANPGIVLKAGAATWKVLAWNGSGYGPWSEERSILIEIPDPTAPAPLPVSPIGSITSSSTQYRWTAVPAAINYRLSIRNNGGAPTYFWYSPAAAGCDAASECSIVPLISRTNGTEQWQVQAWTTTGYGPWSTLVSLTVSITAPLAPVAVSPSGLTTATTVFKWNATANTTYYYVRVSDSTGQRVDKWPTPAQLGCSTGGVCTFTTGVTLASGTGSWQVLAWNPSGYSQWSSTMAFTVP